MSNQLFERNLNDIALEWFHGENGGLNRYQKD
jgi:hypothetical protein